MRSTRLALVVLAGLVPAVITCGGDSTGPQLPVALNLVSGNGQTGVVGQALPNPLVVKVVDVAGGGVPGVTVAWSVTSGSGALSAVTTTTDALGAATVTWTLGPTSGAHTASASIAGIPTIAAAVFSATAAPGPAAKLAFTAHPSTVLAGTAISPAVRVTVQDAHGNTATSATTSITLTITSGTGTSGAVLGGTVTQAAAAGVAAFTDLTIDKEGTGYTLTATAASLTSATSDAFLVWQNLALEFLQSYVSVADNNAIDLSTTWTLEAWVYPTQVSTGTFQDVISKWGGGGNSSYSLAIGATGQLRVVTHDGTANAIVGGKTPLVNGVWQHIAATFDQGTVRIYVNGVLDTTATGIAAPMNSTLELAFGREGAYAGYTFGGAIDEIRIWNVARSAADIASFRTTRLAGNEAGLAGYWRFDEGTGDVASDATGRGNNGRLGTTVGADTWDPHWTTNAAPIH